MAAFDFHNNEIKEGDTLAVAMVRGHSATLQARFVRTVGDGFVVCQPTPVEPKDKRKITRIYNTRNSIIIT